MGIGLIFSNIEQAKAENYDHLPEAEWTYTLPKKMFTTWLSEGFNRAFAVTPRLADSQSGVIYSQLSTSSGKSRYPLMGLDDKTGRLKWINDEIPFNRQKNSVLRESYVYDTNGVAYIAVGEKVNRASYSRIYAIGSSGKMLWSRLLTGSVAIYPQSNGTLLVGEPDYLQKKTKIYILNSKGDILAQKQVNGILLGGKMDILMTSESIKNEEKIRFYRISSFKLLNTITFPSDSLLTRTYGESKGTFEVLSGGTIILPIKLAHDDTRVKLYGYSPSGKQKWTQELPQAKEHQVNGTRLGSSQLSTRTAAFDNRFIVQSENTLSVYDSNNKLIVKKTFSDLKSQGMFTIGQDGTLMFGADYEIHDEKGVPSLINQFYVIDPATLTIHHRLKLKDSGYFYFDFRFTRKNILYIDVADESLNRISKYVLLDK